MSNYSNLEIKRRQFLKYLASSPLIASSLSGCLNDDPGNPQYNDIAISTLKRGSEGRLSAISSVDQALNVFDFEAVAKTNLTPAHYGYIATGVADNITLRANREEFSKIDIRVRRLTGVNQIDMSTKLFGETWQTPIILAPVGSQRAFNVDGEITTAKAAKNKKHLQILSTFTSIPIEDVVKARGKPLWFQLYPATQWNVTKEILRRAESAGCPVVVLTVDMFAGSNRESMKRFKKEDSSICGACHFPGRNSRPMVSKLDFKLSTPLTWDFVQKLKENTSMKVVIKGIVTSEDAVLCLENGVDGIIVSNHGGRAEESGRATIQCLPEVTAAVNGQIPVLIDGGFRRGTDIFKALAMGAQGICIGRPYLWGLAAFGQEGVESVLDMLRAELQLIMKQAGTASIKNITRDYVQSTQIIIP
ncbi:MAG: alpha-hydroxy-acid oxidizing protein [Gammaproteobacteria bacterium]|nr:alpha-hydroxy-acid oxidizing protein [Gammaproteobacteria bacterium]MCP4928411.1 alpha-hydroxy-acid oxidizing protein [Gammaproteobacteria bacterium]